MRNLKKVIALVAVFAMMVSTVAFAQTFTDVAEDHDYYEAIEMLSGLGILTGDDQDGDGKMDFRPADTITRAEVAAIVSRIQGVNSVSQTATEFVDVPQTHWASGYVAAAAGQGIVNGYGDGNFGPDDVVLYEQAIKMLVETLGYAPFVETAGGYPAGHLTAASRYGILDGVVGGSNGAEATRGQVAQMVFNAIDTPLMDRYTYGADAEFLIYDGKGETEGDYRSLLTQYLGVKKFAGIVTENMITSLEAANTIDTEDEAEVVIDFSDEEKTNDYINYEVDEIAEGTLYAGESGIDELIGYHVTGYAVEGDRNNEFVVISAAATSKNKTVSFNLNQFDSVEGATIEYFKNVNDRTSATLKLAAADIPVLFNGVAAGAGDVEDILPALNVVKNSTYGGEVVLIDNNSTAGYDVILVNIAATAVVDEVAANGTVTFKEAALIADGTNLSRVVFDEEDYETIISLTKDGVAMDYNELKEWDVLSVYASGDNDMSSVVLEVLASSVIEGTITSKAASKTAADGYKFTINGKAYDLANGYYANGNLEPGASGLFYIDAYDKLVAYDKNGTTTASDKYAYILNAATTNDDLNGDNLTVQLLDKSGAVYTAYLSDRIKLENVDGLGIEVSGAEIEGTVSSINIKNLDMDTLKDAIINKLVTYDATSDGDIKTITFPVGTSHKDAETTLTEVINSGSSLVDYDEEDMEFNNYAVDENTVVFFIKGASAIDGLGDKDVVASKTASKVGTVASIATGKYQVAGYDEEGDALGAIVLFNTSGGISPASNIAVIESVGEATNDDGDSVLSVEYWMGGEQLYAITDADLEAGDLEDATAGDLWKFSVTADGVITAADLYATVTADRAEKAGEAGAMDITWAKLTGDDAGAQTYIDNYSESFYFGPVVKYASANKRLEIGTFDGTDWTIDATEAIKTAGANVYVYDPMRNNNKISVGVAADVTVDKQLVEKDADIQVDFKDKSVTSVAAGELPLGMFDYVAAVAYEGDVLDVVIYKAYDFGRYYLNEVEA